MTFDGVGFWQCNVDFAREMLAIAREEGWERVVYADGSYRASIADAEAILRHAEAELEAWLKTEAP